MSAINPLRYRGYYYDIETELYYLNSRYYDPETCRFINADDTDVLGVDQDNLLQYNLFTYCLNNPVNMTDDGGDLAFLAAIPLLATVVTVVVKVVVAVSTAAVVGIAASKISYELNKAKTSNVLSAKKKSGSKKKSKAENSQDENIQKRKGGAEHKNNARPSSREKHEEGQARKKRDQGGEKGDARRTNRSNKRRS